MVVVIDEGSVQTGVAFHAPGGLGCHGRNIQATKCVHGGKSRVKYYHLILTPPFRLTPNEAKVGKPY